MRYPKNLPAGGTIGFLAPSFGCATEPYKTAFQCALTRFRSMGYQTLLGPNCYVEQGIGISILNELSLRNWTCDVAAVPLSPPRSMPLGLAVPSLQDASPAVRHFVRYAVRHLTQSAPE